MYIEAVPNRNSPAAILLRESYRDGGKIKKRTIANLSDWPTEIVEGLRTLLKGGKVAPTNQEAVIVRRSLPHGHVAAVLGTLRDIGLDRLLGPARNRCRDLVIAMIVARLIAPTSKLATARMLDPPTAASSLGEVLGLGPVDEDELYVALDWLGERQQAIEKGLARKHLRDGMLVLYDVSSSYLEGRCCELARLGYNRDGKKGKLQIVYGLLCAPDGCPVAIEVFEGNTADPRTLTAQIDKVKKRFALEHVVLVGDRGMITQARITAEIAPAGLDWITALRAPAIRALAEGGALQMSLFDERDMATITSPDYPGERLVVCRNPDLARERTRKRQDLLAATEQDLAAIAAAVQRVRNPLRGEAEIALKVGAIVNRHKMAKHFDLVIGEASFTFRRKAVAIAAEAALDGIYVVRTSLAKKILDDVATVGAYKNLARVERAFRSLKTVDIHLRPIFHWTAPRVRAHVLLCMLAYHVEHRMRARLAPMLYDETDHEAAAAMRVSIVARAERSDAAKRKQTTGRTDDGLPVHSFQSLLADLATYSRIQATTALNEKYIFTLHTKPTPIQHRAFELLGISPDRTQ
ncbi:IS1634 family transposase [Bradyrhizobium sp.]|uniref:IS1634 family transposase n=1 Tax=Bradyrhizobium sp. TaxID=376 RepID=UPI003C76BDF7